MYIFSQKNIALLLQFVLTGDLKCLHLSPDSATSVTVPMHLPTLNGGGKEDQLTMTFKQF